MPAAGDAAELRPSVPVKLLADGAQRMSWVGLALAASGVGVYFTGLYVQQGWINPALAPASYTLSLWGTAATGLLLFALPRIPRLRVQNALDAGLVLQVLAGLFISLAENAMPRSPGEIVRGNSSVAVWIAIFALAVPASFGKALLAALATATTGPIGLTMQVLFGNVPSPAAPMWLILFSGNFLMAGGATVLGRLIYRLGAQIKEAREYGGYRLVAYLGRGGMGEVWRARHRLVERDAAVKLIRPGALGGEPGNSESVHRRFVREAKATASLHSPHTVSLYDYGVSDDGRLYYVMEYLDGLDLEILVSRFGPVPAARAIHILLQACESLAEAHAAGLVHRDVKPRNIFLCRLGASFDFVKVLDFGLVKESGFGQSRLTADGVAMGTPAFIAPEMVTGGPVDARADIYGLGCVAYWLLAGVRVFEAETAVAVLEAHLKETPPSLQGRTANPVPRELEEIVMHCLEKDPTRRPQSTTELAARLEQCALDHAWRRSDADHWWRDHVPPVPPQAP